MAEYSRDCLRELRAETGIRYDERIQGTLQLFRTQAQLDGTGADIAVLKRYGVAFETARPRRLHRRRAGAGQRARQVRRRPAAARRRDRRLLQVHAERWPRCGGAAGVQFRYGTRIQRCQLAGKPIDGVVTDAGALKADAYLSRLGSYSPLLLKRDRHPHPGLPGQGLLDHRADHRRRAARPSRP